MGDPLFREGRGQQFKEYRALLPFNGLFGLSLFRNAKFRLQ